jgi:hypothetical protein
MGRAHLQIEFLCHALKPLESGTLSMGETERDHGQRQRMRIPAKPNTYSIRKRTPVPLETVHGFRSGPCVPASAVRDVDQMAVTLFIRTSGARVRPVQCRS